MNAIVKSEARVPFTDFEIPDVGKFNDLGLLPQGSIDNVVGTFISGGMVYVGLDVSAASTNSGETKVEIDTGVFWRGGPGYALRDVSELDLARYVNLVPDSSKTLSVLIVIDGQEASTTGDITFLDQTRKPADPNAYWPTVDLSGALRVVRTVVPSPVGGTADVQPPDGSYDTSRLLPIARVIVGNTGIVSVAQIKDRQIATLDQLGALVVGLVARAANDELTITGLLSSVSTLTTALRLLQQATQAQITALQQALTALESRQVTAATSSVQTITDIFTDASGLTLQASNPTYAVGTGLTFPKSTVNGSQFFPLVQFAQNVKVISNRYLTVPYNSSGPRGNYGAGGTANFIPMQSLGTWNVPVQTEGFSVARMRYGAAYAAQPTAQLLASGDPTALFAINAGDITYSQNWASWTSYNPELNHQNGYWHDLASRGFWGPRAAGIATGNVFAVDQVMQWDTSFMLLSWGLGTNFGPGDLPDPSTPVRLLICEDLGGYADPNNVIMDITQPWSTGGFYIGGFNMPYPLLIRGGRRYHFVYLTVGNFTVKTVYNAPGGQGGDSTDFDKALQAMLLRSANGAWQQNPTAQVAQVTYTSAVFRPDLLSPIEMNPLALSGGIDTLDVLTPAIVPDGCDLRYGTVPNNSQTYIRLGPISASDPTTNLLAGRPGQVRLFLELVCTTAVAPVLDLQASASGSVGAVSARQAGTLSAESAVRAPVDASNNPLAVTKITRQVTLTGFIAGTHTYTEQLETGAGYTTLTPPTTTGTPVTQADGTTLLTFSWTLAAAVTTFKVKYSGTTTDTTKVFTVSKAITTSTP